MPQPFKIAYTITDEAPALATQSLLPILRSFVASSGIEFDAYDISLAGRILANFPEAWSEDRHRMDALAYLGELAKTPEANIIKLPNISASIPQLEDAIEELRQHRFELPEFPNDPRTPEEQEQRARYAKVLGSAVNPVLREGNSDRRVAAPVKAYARKHPHTMGAWSSESRTHVASMSDGDFYSSEQSHVMEDARSIRIELATESGELITLKEDLALQQGEVIDTAVMRRAGLRAFLAEQIDDAKRQNVLFSIHLKATMMKVSDPIIFGHAVNVFLEPVFEKYADAFDSLGISPNNGIGDLYDKITELPEAQQVAIRSDIDSILSTRPRLAMVNSDLGITNLHVPSDVIIDASMPAAIRAAGQMWGPDGAPHDTKAVIPDRCYAGIYQAVIDFCKTHGAFDVATMGNVANVGLMAQKAEEYGSHDKTFEIPAAGVVRVVDSDGTIFMQHDVAPGDIWRMCQTKDLPIQNWVKLAVERARATRAMAIFWLDPQRAHDSHLIAKVQEYLPQHDTSGLEIEILSPVEATRRTCQRVREGLDSISVTGNVLRDYITDLFPILELGTSAKMLSIVPLLSGGGLFETGAGGSAPKHVQQFVEEGHLRWDSLGEFLAIAASLDHLGRSRQHGPALVLSAALNEAVTGILDHDRSPSRKVNELDTRGSHFYLALYWAQALADQSQDERLRGRFKPLAAALAANEATIVAELNGAQGERVDLGGYYHPDPVRAAAAMRPSKTFNQLIESI